LTGRRREADCSWDLYHADTFAKEYATNMANGKPLQLGTKKKRNQSVMAVMSGRASPERRGSRTLTAPRTSDLRSDCKDILRWEEMESQRKVGRDGSPRRQRETSRGKDAFRPSTATDSMRRRTTRLWNEGVSVTSGCDHWQAPRASRQRGTGQGVPSLEERRRKGRENWGKECRINHIRRQRLEEAG